MFNLTPVVRNLIILNVVIYMIDANLYFLKPDFALYSVLSPYFKPFQFVSYMFLHGGFGHILGNMFALFMFGPMLERIWGPRRFLIFYFVTGIGAGVLYAAINYVELSSLGQAVSVFIEHPNPDSFIDFATRHAAEFYRNNLSFVNRWESDPNNAAYIDEAVSAAKSIYQNELNIPMVGASGAVFGILMAFGMLFPNTELFILFIPFPVKAKYFVAFYGLFSLYSGIQNSPSDNVAHFAHLGGMLFAYILLRYWNTRKSNFY